VNSVVTTGPKLEPPPSDHQRIAGASSMTLKYRLQSSSRSIVARVPALSRVSRSSSFYHARVSKEIDLSLVTPDKDKRLYQAASTLNFRTGVAALVPEFELAIVCG
jgi:hypothetical protein